MAQFQTPQFIEREAKVIGPLTFKMAGYIGAPLAVIFLLYFVLAAENFIVFVALSVLLEGAGVALAFGKVQGKTIPQMLTSAFFFFVKPRTYVWQRGNAKLHFKKEKFVNPFTNGEGLSPFGRSPVGGQKAELVQKSRIANLATRVQTKK